MDGSDIDPSCYLPRINDRRWHTIPVELDRRVPGNERRRTDQAWIPLFEGADQGAIVEAISNAKIVLLEPGDTLLRVGEINHSIFLVLSGQLEVVIGETTPSPRVLPILAGECLGELSAIDGKPVSASVRAACNSRIVQLSQDIFWNQLMAVPGLARNLMSILAERMRRSNVAILEGQRKQIELEHLRQELEHARQLQLGMLPPKPFFPDRSDIDVSGKMVAASFVGGDLFDIFFVEPNRLFFCIGDVSGHGIAAAMFMARTITLIRITAFSETNPAEILKRVNQQLCNGNETCLFVTLLCGFLEIDTGRLVYSNGGHLAPLHWKNGETCCLPIPKGPLVGIFSEAQFRDQEALLGKDEFILLFTDGITEAASSSGEEFSDTRLMNSIPRLAHLPLDRVLDHIHEQVVSHSNESRIEDDCTLLVIRRK